MKNSLKPQKLLEFENYLNENKEICLSLILMLKERIRLGRVPYGCIIHCCNVRLYILKSKKAGFSRSFVLPFNVLITYLKERKELPLYHKL